MAEVASTLMVITSGIANTYLDEEDHKYNAAILSISLSFLSAVTHLLCYQYVSSSYRKMRKEILNLKQEVEKQDNYHSCIKAEYNKNQDVPEIDLDDLYTNIKGLIIKLEKIQSVEVITDEDKQNFSELVTKINKTPKITLIKDYKNKQSESLLEKLSKFKIDNTNCDIQNFVRDRKTEMKGDMNV